MGICVMIEGESGTGKSFAIRNMDPATTSIINVNKKPFPFRQKFTAVKGTDNYNEIGALLSRAVAKSIIIDDTQYLLANEFMRRGKEKGFDKFTDIATNFWSLINLATSLPDDKISYFLHHIERDSEGHEKAKTIGRLLDEKITLEGMFTIVLKTVVLDGNFYFATVNNGHDTVKAPFEMFADQLIPNDLKFVDDSIRDFYGIQIQPTAPAGQKKEKQYATSLV
ncbi:MAG: hypothetical protein WC910_10070 [Bacteroidales bacterium]